MKSDRFAELLDILSRLKEARIPYELAHYRDDAISVRLSVPGERWEVDFLHDGTVDIERFLSGGRIEDESALAELFAKFSDREPETHDSHA